MLKRELKTYKDIFMVKIYLAAAWGRSKEINGIANRIKKIGCYEVVSTWHTDRIELECSLFDNKVTASKKDILELDEATLFILFSSKHLDSTLKSQGMGGRFVELGYCLGNNKPTIFVGEVENIFTSLCDLFFEDEEELVEFLTEKSKVLEE
jgi:hypothetical protein